jgi:hypothetical protein
MRKDSIIEMVAYFLVLAGICFMSWFFFSYIQKENTKNESISKSIIYKCIQGSLWQLSEDRTYFYPVPGSTKCIINEEVRK